MDIERRTVFTQPDLTLGNVKIFRLDKLPICFWRYALRIALFFLFGYGPDFPAGGRGDLNAISGPMRHAQGSACFSVSFRFHLMLLAILR